MKSIRYSVALAVFANIFITLFGCQGNRAWTTTNAWYRAIPENLPESWSKQWESIPNENIIPVPQNKLSSVEDLLSTTTWSKLEEKTVKQLIGRAKQIVEHIPYLVRAVYLNKGTGAYRIFIYRQNLHVKHGSLCDSSVPMKRDVLIVWLTKEPKEVYSTCSMAK